MKESKTHDPKEISFESNQENIITSEYKNWIVNLKLRIRQSQIKAAVKVNTELLRLYWQMGSEIVEKQIQFGHKLCPNYKSHSFPFLGDIIS